MHQITISNGYRVTERIDIDEILLPDGRPAINLSRDDLHRVLSGLKIRGILPSMGRQEMIIQLARHQRGRAA